MGFWNPVQIFVQSQALVHIIALALDRLGGFVGATLWNKRFTCGRRSCCNRFYANLAAKWGWNKEHFKAVELLKSSGTDVCR